MAVFLLVSILAVYVGCIHGLSCVPQHPQEAFCRSDFVVRAKLIEYGEAPDFGKRPIMAEIRHIYKGHEKVNASKGDIIKIFQSMWGPKIKMGQLHLLSGSMNEYFGGPMLDSCNWVQQWRKITFVQRWGLKRYYAKFCGKCQIKFCLNGENCDLDKGCPWWVQSYEIGQEKTDCQSRMELCTYRRSKGCSWYRPKLRCVEPGADP